MDGNEVDRWFQDYDNPMKGVMQRVRERLLAADERLEESIQLEVPDVRVSWQPGELQSQEQEARQPDVPHGSEHSG
jgi:hypothetical protein